MTPGSGAARSHLDHIPRMQEVVVDADELARRVIEPDDFVPDTHAFVDVRLPRSAGKASYSFIGPGVSQNAEQVVNLREPHGFNVGAASMPHGVINNPHLHYTAEVFICSRGRWRMTIGENGSQTLEIGEGSIFSVPTWVFRGFENIGADDGWLYAVLGGDETGGIIWAPDVLRQAAETGLYLRSDHSLLDADKGDPIDDIVVPLDPAQLQGVDRYTDAELDAHVVTTDELVWSDHALLSSVLDGHGSALAPVIGYGLTEDRHHRAPISTPHGFSIEWLRVAPGAHTGSHRHAQTQVVLVTRGAWEVAVNRDDQTVRTRPAEGSVVSIPAGAWRDLCNVGDAFAYALVICGTDQQPTIDWHPDIVTGASERGVGRDAASYLAPVALLGREAS